MTSAKQIYLGVRRGTPTPPLPYDAEVEYLESTGTQWIDTQVLGRDNLKAVCRFAATGFTADATFYFPYGAVNGRVSISVYGPVPRNSTHSSWMIYANSPYSSGWPYVNTDTLWHTSVMDSTSLDKSGKIDDTTLFSGVENQNSTTSNYGIALFGMRLMDGGINTGIGRISMFKLTDTATDSVLVDFAPVRFTNELGQSEGAMYDRVSGALFRNAGTGAFTIGPDKS
jgi:hypothetical protein